MVMDDDDDDDDVDDVDDVDDDDSNHPTNVQMHTFSSTLFNVFS